MNLSATPTWWIWASVVIFAVHNVEEAISVEQWAARHLRPKRARRFKTGPFCVAVCLLWLFYVVVATLAAVTDDGTAGLLFVLSFAAIVANATLHVLAPLFLREKPPGFWTALILTLPLGAWIGCYAVGHALLSPLQAALLLLAGAVLQSPVAAGALFAANLLLNRHRRT